jgi:uncharacterized protein (TIGR02118 family)
MAKRGDKLPLEFKTEWLELNGQLKRTANRVTVGMPTSEKPPFDGFAALYYSTVAKAKEALSDKPGRQEVLCEEFVSGEKLDAAKTVKPKEQIKVVRLIIRKKDMSLADFKKHWLTNYVKLEKRLTVETPVLRVTANLAVAPEPGGNEPYFDGMEELYLASLEDFNAMLASPIPALMRKEEENFVQHDAPTNASLMVEETTL